MWPTTAAVPKHADPPAKTACRICHMLEETRADPLVAPCLCDGSMRYVHNSCQQAWLRARRGRLEYRCELCRTGLAHRLTMATRFELVAMSTASATLWATQLSSAVRVVRLVTQLLTIGWRHEEGRLGAGRFLSGTLLLGRSLLRDASSGAAIRGHFRPLPPSSSMVASCAVLAQSAAMHAMMVGIVVTCACAGLSFLRRPLVIVGEDVMTRFCIIKIGGCVLALLHEMLLIFPPAQRIAPLSAWHVIGTTLFLDTVLLAFLRIPRQERHGRSVLRRVAHTACRLTTDFLPFAAVFFLWSASIFVIFAASLVPCIVLLFREVVRDVRRRRHQNGSIQMVLFLLRAILHILTLLHLGRQPATSGLSMPAGAEEHIGNAESTLSGYWARGTREFLRYILTVTWLATEGAILADISILKIGVYCAREGLSQAMWSIAVAGQVALVVHSRARALTSFSSTLRDTDSSRTWSSLLSLWPSTARGPLSGNGVSNDLRTRFLGCCEDAALFLCIICFLCIHVPVFLEKLWRLKQAFVRALTQIEPSQVIFCDRPIPVPASRARSFWRRWLLIQLWY